MTDPKLTHPLAALADRIAAEAHAGQTRRWSEVPFIAHPRRVARLVARLDGTDEIDVAAAVLHDTIEDTMLTAVALREKLAAGGTADDVADAVVSLVLELTQEVNDDSEEGMARRADAGAPDWGRLRAASERSRRIKLCDRLDNLSGHEPFPADLLRQYLPESRAVVALCGDADPILGGWLLSLIDSLSASTSDLQETQP